MTLQPSPRYNPVFFTMPGGRRRAVPARIVVHLQATQHTQTVAEQAEALGVSISYIRLCRSVLIKAGELDPEQRLQNRPFTPAEIARCRRLLESGFSVPAIAAAMETSPGRVARIIARQNVVAPAKQPPTARSWYTVEEVAALLGVSGPTVRMWIDRDLLVAGHSQPQMDVGTAKRARLVNRGHFRIDRAAILDWLRDDRSFVTLTPRIIRDPELRRAAETFQVAAGGCWVPAREVCVALSYAPYAFTDWRKRGWPGEGWRLEQVPHAWHLWVPTGATLPPPPPDRRVER